MHRRTGRQANRGKGQAGYLESIRFWPQMSWRPRSDCVQGPVNRAVWWELRSLRFSQPGALWKVCEPGRVLGASTRPQEKGGFPHPWLAVKEAESEFIVKQKPNDKTRQVLRIGLPKGSLQ